MYFSVFGLVHRLPFGQGSQVCQNQDKGRGDPHQRLMAEDTPA